MWTPDYFVRLADLPAKVEGVTIPNDDGTFDIYINALFCRERQQVILEHELCHIKKDHFYNDVLPIQEIECEADDPITSDRVASELWSERKVVGWR